MPTDSGEDAEQREQRVAEQVLDPEAGQVEERLVAEHGPADDAGGDGRDDDHAERPGREVPQDDLHREHDAGQRRVERGRDTARGAARDEQSLAVLAARTRRPTVDPSADPICTIGPSRPTDPPPPMQSAEASDFTTATRGGMRPPRRATAYMTSGTPWPRASGAPRWTSGPYSRPAITGAAITNHRPTPGNHSCGAPGVAA